MTSDQSIKNCARALRDQGAYRCALAVEELAEERDAALRLLAASARGELSRCATCGDRLATRLWEDSGDEVCDVCFAEGEAEARADGVDFDANGCVDLPNAEALRAAMAVATAAPR